MTPNEFDKVAEQTINVPLLGKVAAGNPINNDIVIVEQTNTAKNGEIVVAMNDDNEVTLKTFYKEKNFFRLQPENDLMLPIILKKVTILGKAIGLYRKI